MFSHSLIQSYVHPPPSTSVSTSLIKSMETTLLRVWHMMFSQWCWWWSKLLGCDNTSLWEWMLAFQESHYHLQRCQSLKALEFFTCHKQLTQHHSVTAQKTRYHVETHRVTYRVKEVASNKHHVQNFLEWFVCHQVWNTQWGFVKFMGWCVSHIAHHYLRINAFNLKDCSNWHPPESTPVAHSLLL